MRRKKIRNLLLAIIVSVIVIAVILIIAIANKGTAKRLEELYNGLNTTQTYLFEMIESENNKTIMAKKGNKTIIDAYIDDSHTTTIVKDNNTYLVLHDRKEYYVYEQNNVEQSILTDALKDVVGKEFVTGTEKVKGKKYSYEEYQGSTMFMKTGSLDINEEDIKTRFYFDNENNLVYIRTIKGVNQELLEVKMKKEVDDSVFEIPSDYAEN